jgi:hypothetical protein
MTYPLTHMHVYTFKIHHQRTGLPYLGANSTGKVFLTADKTPSVIEWIYGGFPNQASLQWLDNFLNETNPSKRVNWGFLGFTLALEWSRSESVLKVEDNEDGSVSFMNVELNKKGNPSYLHGDPVSGELSYVNSLDEATNWYVVDIRPLFG